MSPRTRIEPLADSRIPTLQPHLIEPFLDEPMIVAAGELDWRRASSPRPEDRVLITRGDRAYARGRAGTPLVETDPRRTDVYRVFRKATPLRDPLTSEVLGYEAQYLGGPQLVRSEVACSRCATSNGKTRAAPSCRPRSTSSARRKKCASATACCPSRRAS